MYGARAMSTHTINIFISHSWTYSNHYVTLSSWIFTKNWSMGQASLDFKNFSVPRNDPIHNAPSAAALKKRILNKIARCHVIIIPTGMYANHSKWIRKELDGADKYSKPVLAVIPWAQEKKPSVVQHAATQIVGWNKKSVIKAIWNLYKS